MREPRIFFLRALSDLSEIGAYRHQEVTLSPHLKAPLQFHERKFSTGLFGTFTFAKLLFQDNVVFFFFLRLNARSF